MPVRTTVALAFLGVLGLLLVTARSADAQTWRWQYISHMSHAPPLTTQSTLTLSSDTVTTSYTAQIGNRQMVIAACRAALGDLQQASAVRSNGRAYLLLRLKPQKSAQCESGRETGAALPADDFALIDRVAAALNRAVTPRAVAVASPSPRAQAPSPRAQAPSPTPRPKPSPSPRTVAVASPTPSPQPPSPSPSPRPTATPGARLVDWVENEGLFLFVRVHNSGDRPATITDGEVRDCRNADVGCGPFAHVTIDPKATATVATVASSDLRKVPTFSYRYSATAGDATVAGGGASSKSPPSHATRMSATELRAAEAVALGALRAPSSPAPVAAAAAPANPDGPPRLVKRGSSRLAIGQTGSAQVRLLIAENGAPEQATIVSVSNRKLVAAAIETAVSSTYAPAIRNGKPVAANYVATFSFDGTDPATSSIPVWRRSPMPEPAAQSATSPAAAPAPSPSP